MNKLWILLLLAAVLPACTTEQPTATPIPAPSAPPVAAPIAAPTVAAPTAVLPATAAAVPSSPATPVPTMISPPVEQPDIRCEAPESAIDVPEEIDEVVEQQGFAMHPTHLPSGFRLAGVSNANSEVRQIYQMDGKNIILAYPIEFSADILSDPLGWERPQDALNSVQIGDQMAHFMIGGWSDASIIAGPALRPDRAEWDYEKSVALFFICRVSGGRDLGMAIQALPGPIDWIDADGIISIAHSLKRIPRTR